ncbi:unnamed protein product [Spodoptera exigua]|nr:unnamed protein product [Spodoptera exigua]
MFTYNVPLHFAIHRPGCHFESCCGICNLFPGVLLIAFCQVLVGSILLTLILTHGPQYDEMHMTPTTQFISLATGIVLSGITGAGILLIVVALTENCRAMLLYLNGNVERDLVNIISFCKKLQPRYWDKKCTLSRDGIRLPITLLSRQNITFIIRTAKKWSSSTEYDLGIFKARVNRLPCLSIVVLYFFSIVVVFSFYHFRYVRRAILLHENECE